MGSGRVTLNDPGAKTKYKVVYKNDAGEEVVEYRNKPPHREESEFFHKLRLKKLFRQSVVQRLVEYLREHEETANLDVDVSRGKTPDWAAYLREWGVVNGWVKLKRVARLLREYHKGKGKDAYWDKVVEWIQNNARKYWNLKRKSSLEMRVAERVAQFVGDRENRLKREKRGVSFERALAKALSGVAEVVQSDSDSDYYWIEFGVRLKPAETVQLLDRDVKGILSFVLDRQDLEAVARRVSRFMLGVSVESVEWPKTEDFPATDGKRPFMASVFVSDMAVIHVKLSSKKLFDLAAGEK